MLPSNGRKNEALAGMLSYIKEAEMRFRFVTVDKKTEGRENGITQVQIRTDEWPGNTVLLWFPEAVGPVWENWNPDGAYQDFIVRDSGVSWVYDLKPQALVEAVLKAEESSLMLNVHVTNRSREMLEKVSVQNCCHLKESPDFACGDHTRIFIRTEGKWMPLSELSPQQAHSVYYKKDYLESGDTDYWDACWGESRENHYSDYPLMVCVSKDGKRSIATASENYRCVFHNSASRLMCIHSNQCPVPTLAPGATETFRQKIYFVEGGLEKAIATYEASVLNGNFID
jgi:hypothetical protein